MNITISLRWIVAIVLVLSLGACSTNDKSKDVEEREYQRKLKEARELADKIRKGDIFDEEALVREKLLRPESVCALGADFTSTDFGPSPDFRPDGDAILYSDKSTMIYYYYFPTRQRFRLAKNGRNPSFGSLPKNPGDQKFIYERYLLKKNSWEGGSAGLMMNTEANWLSDAKQITSIPGTEPYLVNDDQFIVYRIDDKWYQLDDKMESKQITKEEYNNLRDSRYTFENAWTVHPSYHGIQGVWITDLEQKKWCQIRSAKDIRTIKVVPKSYNIYFWGAEISGICLIKPADMNRYTVEMDSMEGVSLGDLFDIYEKKVSPISHEVIGYDESQYKGTLEVVEILDNKSICEYQTRLYMEGIFAGDIAVFQKNNQRMGKIL